MNQPKEFEHLNSSKLALITIGAVIILGVSVFAAYKYSKAQRGNIILPGGVTYIGPTPENQGDTNSQPQPTPVRFTASHDTPWKDKKGKIYPYTISYPETLELVFFIDDPLDSIAISWKDIPSQQNILINMEFIEERDPSYLDKPKIQFVREYHKFFPGLIGTSKVERFENSNGLIGYKASYINNANQSPNIDVFFEIPGENNMMIRLGNGILDPDIFDRIVDSVSWKKF